MITPIQRHPAPPAAHACAPATAVSSKLCKDTVYMPSSVAARVLGTAGREARDGNGGARRAES